ncbi:hypothetical protein PV326_005825 [Microctonus aethiopoides]|nr:hypothetical protein PV326_005825 [Microctonus aethiopoides]
MCINTGSPPLETWSLEQERDADSMSEVDISRVRLPSTPLADSCNNYVVSQFLTPRRQLVVMLIRGCLKGCREGQRELLGDVVSTGHNEYNEIPQISFENRIAVEVECEYIYMYEKRLRTRLAEETNCPKDFTKGTITKTTVDVTRKGHSTTWCCLATPAICRDIFVFVCMCGYSKYIDIRFNLRRNPGWATVLEKSRCRCRYMNVETLGVLDMSRIYALLPADTVLNIYIIFVTATGLDGGSLWDNVERDCNPVHTSWAIWTVRATQCYTWDVSKLVGWPLPSTTLS